MNEVGKVGLFFMQDIFVEIWWVLRHFVVWHSCTADFGFVLPMRLFYFVVNQENIEMGFLKDTFQTGRSTTYL